MSIENCFGFAVVRIRRELRSGDGHVPAALLALALAQRIAESQVHGAGAVSAPIKGF